uniref:ATP synthase subunit a n=1 Tax=Aphrophora sp. EMHAU-15062701 TaxID=2042339 RepID=A0A343KJA0_9HEMI|nr:ATP synthase F0 subunit 6 [Aphrophora sp. EMHAU-15062701]
MMTNLFSVFDPSTGIFSFNWLSTYIGLFLIPLIYWYFPSRLTYLYLFFIKSIFYELKMLLGLNSKGSGLLLISLFMFILFNNIMGLLPYVFTSSSHLIFTLSLSLPLWLMLMIFGWLNYTNKMFYHLIPLGTPPLLMPFMVLIETTSNIIRPGSLAVRLTANMIAGHLLMSLLGNMALNLNFFFLVLIILVHFLLMIFELAVGMIQSYVFTILMTLYSSEI